MSVPQTMLVQSAPPQSVPQTMLSPPEVPQTMLSPSTAVPHTMLSPSPAVPQTMLSPSLAVPHTMLSPVEVPQTMLSPSAPDDVVAVLSAPDDVVAVHLACPTRCCRRSFGLGGAPRRVQRPRVAGRQDARRPTADGCPRRCCLLHMLLAGIPLARLRGRVEACEPDGAERVEESGALRQRVVAVVGLRRVLQDRFDQRSASAPDSPAASARRCPTRPARPCSCRSGSGTAERRRHRARDQIRRLAEVELAAGIHQRHRADAGRDEIRLR